MSKPNALNTALAEFITIFNLFESSKNNLNKLFTNKEVDDDEFKIKKGNLGVNLAKSKNAKNKNDPTVTKFKAFNFQKRGNTHFTKYEMPLSHFAGQNFWIMKATNLNRGRGIHVFNDLKSLKKLIEDYCKGVDKSSLTDKSPSKQPKKAEVPSLFPEYDNARIGNHNETKYSSPTKSNYGKKKFHMNSFIIQKYIEKPLLIYKRKFDIRVWVLVSNTGKCYFFKEGYLRTSGSEFYLDSNNADDQYVHLTNNAIQKHSKTYGEFEDGNQMSFKQFQAYIDTHYADSGINFYRDCIPKMKAMIKHSLLAARK